MHSCTPTGSLEQANNDYTAVTREGNDTAGGGGGVVVQDITAVGIINPRRTRNQKPAETPLQPKAKQRQGGANQRRTVAALHHEHKNLKRQKMTV